MLTKLLDLILEFWEDLKFWVIIPVFDMALVLRWGKSHRVIGPGRHWKLPFGDQVHEHTVVATTISTGVQSIMTKDGKQIAAKSVIKYYIFDVKLFVETIYDAADALVDTTQGKTAELINSRTYEECMDTVSLSNTLAIKVRAEVKKHGIGIESITLTDTVETPSFRLFSDTEINM